MTYKSEKVAIIYIVTNKKWKYTDMTGGGCTLNKHGHEDKAKIVNLYQ